MPRVKKTRVCPYGASGVGGKWMFRSMYHLSDGPRRLYQLRRLMPQASRQMLVTQLRALERAGAVRRTVSAGIPPRVTYSLTEFGRESEPIVRRLHEWGEQFGGDVDWLVSLGGRWKVWVVHTLSDGARRFSDIQRQLAPISSQALSRELRELTGLGLVHRLPASPQAPRGAYALTTAGAESAPVFRQLHAWGRWTSERLGVDFDWPVDTVPEPRRA